MTNNTIDKKKLIEALASIRETYELRNLDSEGGIRAVLRFFGEQIENGEFDAKPEPRTDSAYSDRITPRVMVPKAECIDLLKKHISDHEARIAALEGKAKPKYICTFPWMTGYTCSNGEASAKCAKEERCQFLCEVRS